MEDRRNQYSVKLIFNGRSFKRVVIDQHYQENHAESMNDSLILELVNSLDGANYPIDDEIDEFQYLTIEPIMHKNRPYRVILVLSGNDDFLGVVNAFRVNI